MEEKIDLDSFSKNIESLKEVSIKSKDYIKFIIGLSTGTLILSATLAKDFFKTPQYNFILIIGWALLFISIVVGVWILPVWDSIQGTFALMKKIFTTPKEELRQLIKRRLGEYYIVNWMKQLTPSELIETEEFQKFFKLLEDRLNVVELKPSQLKDLKKWTEDFSLAGVRNEYRQTIKDLVAQTFSFYSLVKEYEKLTYFPGLLKSIRWTIWQMRYLEKVMRYSFFIGMFAILVFAIINFIK
jgi:hypothetical protein